MSQSKEIISYMRKLGSEAKEASMVLAQASLENKNEALGCIADEIESKSEHILNVNSE